MTSNPYTLTPADIMDLRASVRWRLSDQTLAGPELPFICYAREDRMAQNAPGYDPDAFVLHTQGHIRAISKRPEVLAACLRAEWAEPGFVARILNPSEDCQVAALAPDEAARLRSRRLFEEKAAREYAEEQRRAREPAPVVPQPDPTTITLESLFDD